ncbi:hypothetical protein G6M16_010700 [Agrobacterium tumefaciens]|nr:hypothetical protein [Agrobacterium tumefaciens]WCA58148.1 hypothetical protein G6M16_010700 [Agrobacterium tumefaciens]
MHEHPNLDFETQLSNEAFWRDVFGPDNEPQREIKPGSRYRTLPGWFPTSKNVRGRVRTREPLMADLMIHLDTDPAIRVVAEFPIKTNYHVRRLDGTVVTKEHIPDLAALRRDGRVLVIDVMPWNVQQDIPWLQRRREALRAHYSKLGARYLLLDETSLRLQPLLNNLKLMWMHKSSGHDLNGMAQIRQALRDTSYPATMEDLVRTMPLNAIVARWSDEDESAARHVTECNPIFTAVMQLAMSGEVDVDLTKRFSPSTLVSRKEMAHA